MDKNLSFYKKYWKRENEIYFESRLRNIEFPDYIRDAWCNCCVYKFRHDNKEFAVYDGEFVYIRPDISLD
jgi:hypothetical protein